MFLLWVSCVLLHALPSFRQSLTIIWPEYCVGAPLNKGMTTTQPFHGYLSGQVKVCLYVCVEL